ncbi:hypothetical protein GC173_04210 [bacterium]|nr:hypothetical protein [bacterium]
MRALLRGTTAAALLALLPSIGLAAFDLMRAVPASYEVVASLDTRQVIDSAPFKANWPLMKKPESDAQLALLKSLTGVDLLTDIDRISLFCRVNDDPSVGVVLEGRFDPAKLVTIVQASGTHKSYDISGSTIHEWYDKGESRTKYACFPEAGTLIIWNSEEAMKLSTAALATPEAALKGKPEATVTPADADKLAGWAILITRQQTCPGAKLRLSAAAVTLALNGDQVDARFLATPESPAVAAQWLDLAEGVKAIGQIQRDNPALAEFAGRLTVEPLDNGKVVQVRTSMKVTEMVDLAKRMKQ